MTRKRLLLAAGVLVLAGVGAYARSFNVPFIFDDLTSIPDNPNIRQLWPITKPMSPPPELGAVGGRPLVGLSLAVNYALGGYDVRGYHVFNLLVHLLCALLLWRIAARTLASPALGGRFGGEGTAFAIALLWSVHPLLSEPITYVVQRTELMMAACYLLTLFASLRAWTSERPGRWQAVSIAACALGMACKEPMVSAPLAVVLHDVAFRARPVRELLRERARFYAGLCGAWLVLLAILLGGAQTKGALGGHGAYSSFSYLKLQALALTHYLWLAVWPHPLTIAYDWSVPSLLGALPHGLAVLALVAGTVWAFRSGWAWLGFLGAWFFMILAPTSSVLPLHTEPIAERRMYLPLAAVVALVVVGARWLIERLVTPEMRPRLAAALTAAAALALAATTFTRVGDYRSVLSIWEDALRKSPNSTTIRNNLGNAYAFAGRFDDAIAQYREAVRINPTHPLAYYNIGFTLVHQGKNAEAVAPATEAVRLREKDYDTQYILARALAGSGQPAESLVHYEAALTLAPGDGEIRRDYAAALVAVGRLPEAIHEFRQAVNLRPNDAAAHSKLGNVLATLGAQDEAIASYREALRIAPTDARTRNNLASALVRSGRAPEAIEELHRALRDDARYGLGHYNLANILAQNGRAAEATREYLETIRVSPDDAKLRQLAFDHLLQLRATPEAAAVLSEAARDKDASVRNAASQAVAARS